MNWNDLTSAWRRQPEGELIAWSRDFETQHRKLAKKLFWRDMREVIGGLVLVVFFLRTGWRRNVDFWPFTVAASLGLGLVVFFVAERLRAHRRRPAPGASLLGKLEADIAELQHQKRLMTTVGFWYIPPLFAAWAIVLVSRLVHPVGHPFRHPIFLVGYIVGGVIFMTWGVWARNRRAVRKKIEPRLAELQRLHRDLISPN